VFSLRHHPTYRSHRVTLPRLKYIKDTLGVLNSPNNGILIGIGIRRRPVGLEERRIDDRANRKRRRYRRRFWCTNAWNRPTSTGAGGSDPLWLCWRGTPWLAIRWRGYAAFKWSQSERQSIFGRRAITNRDIETALD
jgi:hypothetical protein